VPGTLPPTLPGIGPAPMRRTDADLLAHVTATLAALPGVEAVALGGSRAAGTHRPDSDWDLAIYYRGTFDPDDLRATGWPGEISDLGGWGGGVFNGGAWLDVEGRRYDVHYRDLDDVEHHWAQARAGRFGIEHLLHHLAGIPTYLVVAELAGNRALHGSLPRPAYPPALRARAPHQWWGRARATLHYARTAHAAAGHALETAGAAGVAATETAHAVLAAHGTWVTNEKRLLDLAGLRRLDPLAPPPSNDPTVLTRALDDLTAALTAAVTTALAAAPTPDDGP